MNYKNLILFLIPSFIWGSTWYVIKFQLGTVDPMVSVSYRFLLAGVILTVFSLLFKVNLKLSLKQHLGIAILGISLFGINYWLVYVAEQSLKSGLVAIIFSLIIFFNIFLNALLLKGKIKREVIFGAVLGFGGTILMFKNEFDLRSLNNSFLTPVALCLGAALLASFGNIVSARLQKNKIAVLPANAFGMMYGGLFMLIFSILSGTEINFEISNAYISSLLYLSVFGSVIAFSAYLVLLGNIGPDRAGYTVLLIPVISIAISSVFENYTWNFYSLSGIGLLITGGIMALKFKKKQHAKIQQPG